MVKNSDLMKGKRGGDSRRRQQPLDCVGHRALCRLSDLSRGVTVKFITSIPATTSSA